MTKKCNPGVGAVPVNVIMIVLQIGPTYQTCIYFAEKLMVPRQVGSPTPIGYSADIEIELRYLSTSEKILTANGDF